MVKYECKFCLFETRYKTNFERHNQSKKHIAFCENEQKIRKEFIDNENKIKKELENKEIQNKKDIEIKFLKEKIEFIEKSNKCLSTIATTSTKTAQSALSFIMNNYPDAPTIKKYNNFEFLKEKSHYKIADSILHKYKHKTLVEYLSNLLIDHYKKENPNDQAVWNTDVARLSYVVKDNINKQNISKWIVDKKGHVLSSYTVQPIIDKLRDRMNDSYKKISKDNKKYNDDRDDYLDSDSETKDKKRTNNKKIEKTMSYLEHFNGFFHDIDSGILESDIIKNIAGHFFLNEKV